MKNFNHTSLFGAFLLLLAGSISSCGAEQATGEESDIAETAEIDEASKSSVKGSHLMEVTEVKMLYDEGKAFKVIEISKADKYTSGHLPGAVNFWRPDYEGRGYEYGGMRASPEEMAELLGSNGISPEDKLIIYDTKGSVDAIRFMWILDMYGHADMAVMNGGKAAWKKAGYNLSTEPAPKVQEAAYHFSGKPDYTRLAGIADVLAAMQDTDYLLLDTREPEEYQGAPYISKGVCYPYKHGAFTNGRIPGSVHLNWSDAVDLNGDHRFKSLKDLKHNFEKAGVTPGKKIIAYCQSGVRSAHTTYVLAELLGYPDVRNYDGSWIEWSYNYVNNKNVEIESDLDEETHKRRLAELEAELQQQQPAVD